MSQCLWFRAAVEAQFQISQGAPQQQGGLRSGYNQWLSLASETAKVDREEMHLAIVKRGSAYNRARMAGSTEEEAFDIAAPSQQPDCGAEI